MREVVVVRDSEVPWQEPPSQWAGNAAQGEPSLRFKRLLPSVRGCPNMQRTRYDPHHHEPLHAHPEDEVLYILGGSVRYGEEELGPGDTLFIPRDTRYSLTCGEAGAEFLRVGLSDLAPPDNREDRIA